MTSIYHIDQLPYSVALEFTAGSTDRDPKTFRVTEKIDGSNVSICCIDKKMHIKTKKAEPTRDPEVFRKLADKFETPLMNEFARFLEVVLEIEEELVKIFLDNGIEQLFGELVPVPKPNIIQYSPEHVLPGVFYIFDEISVDIRTALINAFKYKWNIYYAPDVDEWHKVVDFSFALKDFFQQYGEQLQCRRRDTSSVERKEKAKDLYTHMLKQWKQVFICEFPNVRSHLGAEQIEGLIIENRLNGIKIKIVDMDGFGAVRAEEWAGSDTMKDQRKQLFKDLVNNVFNGADILINTDKQDQKIQEMLEGVDSFHEYEVLDVLCKDAVKESGLTVETIIEKAKEAFDSYLSQLLVINPVGLSVNAVKTEVKHICNILVTLDSGYNGTIMFTLIEYVLGYKRYEEIKRKYCAGL